MFSLLCNNKWLNRIPLALYQPTSSRQSAVQHPSQLIIIIDIAIVNDIIIIIIIAIINDIIIVIIIDIAIINDSIIVIILGRAMLTTVSKLKLASQVARQRQEQHYIIA